jgi:hypothetical protein
MDDWLKRLVKTFSLPGIQSWYPRILITGVGKTGSTALFYAILKSLPPETLSLFEPDSKNETLPENIKPPVLVKSFIPYCEHFNFFEKKILLIRDPRDQLVSTLLYRPYNLINRASPEEYKNNLERIQLFQEMLKRKENNQADVSFLEMCEVLQVIDDERIKSIIDYFKNHPEAFIFKYEDYIKRNLTTLENFLEIKIDRNPELPERRKRVTRSKSYGDWKNWLTPSDMEYFRPYFQEFLSLFAYPDDWELNLKQKIDPALSSIFVENLVVEATKNRNERESLKR